MSLTSLFVYVLLGLLAYLLHRHRQRLNYWKNMGIAFDEPHFLLGNTWGVRKTRTFADCWMETYNKYKGTAPFVGFFFFLQPTAFILDTTLAKNILIRDFNKFTDRGFYSNPKDDPLSGQLFLLDGQKWRNMRNKLSPTFTSGKMKYMFPTVMRVGAEFVQAFSAAVKQNAILEVKELMARFTTDVIGSCAFGLDCNSLKDPNAEFRVMGRRAVTEQTARAVMAFIFSFKSLSRKLGLKMTPAPISEFFMRIVRESVEHRMRSNIRRNDFLDMLIDLKNKKLMKSEHGDELTNLTLEEIAAQAFVFLVAGFETSSTTMGFALYELAQHEDIQQRARAEVDEVLAKHDGEFTYECMKEMQYLDQCISETLRLYTVLPVLNREALEDYVVPGNPKYVIKKGISIVIPAGAMHRDERYYPNPDAFNPDNFTPEKVQQRDSIEWLPFGDGPRNCIGMRFGLMQTRVGLALLLKHFKFSVCAQTQIPMQYNKENFLVASEGGIYLKVEEI